MPTFSKAYRQGFDAVDSFEDDNPFDSYTEETQHADWIRGLYDGQADRSIEADYVPAFEDYDDVDDWADDLDAFGYDGDLLSLL